MRIFTLILAITLLSTITLNNKQIGHLNVEINVKNDTITNEYNSYKEKADSVLLSEKTKMTGQMLADAWLQTKNNYGVDVPVSLALAQAKLESSYGMSKLSIQKNNPYSLRGSKSYKTFNSMSDGVLAYYKLMATRYLACKDVDQLLRNFVSCSGYRYAGSKNYEYTVKKEIQSIEQKFQ